MDGLSCYYVRPEHRDPTAARLRQGSVWYHGPARLEEARGPGSNVRQNHGDKVALTDGLEDTMGRSSPAMAKFMQWQSCVVGKVSYDFLHVPDIFPSRNCH
jgi:hypothetical protein